MGNRFSGKPASCLLPAVLLAVVACQAPERRNEAPAAVASTERPSGADTVRGAEGATDRRPVPEGGPAEELTVALENTLDGPDGESTTTDQHSWFSAATAGALDSVSVDPAGNATVDFRDLRPLIPNASSSAGSAILLRELNATVFGVDGIQSVEYRMAGSCELFWEWLQYPCARVTREQARADTAAGRDPPPRLVPHRSPASDVR